MNAGFAPKGSWLHGPEGGGRNLGEACHIYDLFVALVGSRVVDVQARGIGFGRGRYAHNDNFVATLAFEDGSLATLTYTALGTNAWPKEHLEAFWDDTVAVMEDYRALSFHGQRFKGISGGGVDKGHKQEWLTLAEAHRKGDWAIPLEEQLLVAGIALQVEQELGRG
jgi:predicted dehydrogenase